MILKMHIIIQKSKNLKIGTKTYNCTVTLNNLRIYIFQNVKTLYPKVINWIILHK